MTRRDNLRFLRGPEHACGYLPQQRARNLYYLPGEQTGSNAHGALSRQGFRRSGSLLYRPDCPDCHACQATRIPVARFRPDRAQRRIWQRNSDLSMNFMQAHFSHEHFRLYRDYMSHRHPGGGMDDGDAEQYWAFLQSTWSQTRFQEFRLAGKLLAVAVVDELDDGLSAMYTFFSPHHPRRSLGTYAILCQIAEAHRRELPWLYLGYWIRQSRKMAYKANFRPIQVLGVDGWEDLDARRDV